MASGKINDERSDRFADRDVAYFRNEQYATSENLNARIHLHAKYATSPIDWFEWLRSFIEWHNVDDVLEVGCGTGLFWSRLPVSASKDLRVTLTDLSPAMVAVATRRALEGLKGVTGVEANVQTLPFDDSSFDLVIANQMLYHATDPARALDELHRVLRPGGTLMAATNGPNHLRELFEIKSEALGINELRSNADVFGSRTGRELLEDSFIHVTWHQYDDQLRCTDVDDVVAYLTSTPPGEEATPEEVEQLRSETESRMRRGGGVLNVTKDTGVFMSQRAPVPT